MFFGHLKTMYLPLKQMCLVFKYWSKVIHSHVLSNCFQYGDHDSRNLLSWFFISLGLLIDVTVLLESRIIMKSKSVLFVNSLCFIRKGVTTLSEKAMATHPSTLAWRIPWAEEPGGLQSMGSWRVGHDWATSLSFFTFMHWRRKWQPTPVFLPGESQGQRSLVGGRLWGHAESDTTEAT